jgi:hypothetical protein
METRGDRPRRARQPSVRMDVRVELVECVLQAGVVAQPRADFGDLGPVLDEVAVRADVRQVRIGECHGRRPEQREHRDK